MANKKKQKSPGGLPEAPKVLADGVELTLPILNTGQPGVTGRLDFRVSRRQRRALQLMFDGLLAEGESVQLTALRPVKLHSDVIRWILDRVAETFGISAEGMTIEEHATLERERLARLAADGAG